MFNLIPSHKDKLKKRVFWWEPNSGVQNAGDHLARVIVEQMLMLQDKEILEKKNDKNKLLSIGSVMHFAQNNDTVWGTGINGKVNESLLKFKKLDVRAVRGPLTRKFLIDRGYLVPEIYGDPGLLLPLFFDREVLMRGQKEKDYVVIPHMNEELTQYKKYSDAICSPKQGAIAFTREIISSKFVVSSSLHGVIIAEAYGIPAVLLANKSGEAQFKYDDYYLGTGRKIYPVAQSVDEAFSITPATSIDARELTRKLFASFPYDLW